MGQLNIQTLHKVKDTIIQPLNVAVIGAIRHIPRDFECF